MKRLAVISDLHSGHRVGLTPPHYQSPCCGEDYLKVQQELYNAYISAIKAIQPIHLLVVNGDSVDGKGSRSGSSELIVTDRHVQGRMASDAILETNAKHIIMTRGTGYHTGSGEDFEDPIAERLGADIADQQFIELEGVKFDFKHHIGNTSLPYGRGTQPAKERLQNLLSSEYDEEPKADVIVRSHVHYHAYIGEPGWLAMTTPALQGSGSKFGNRRCSGVVHFGIVWFDCEGGKFAWDFNIIRVKSQKQPLKKF